MTVGQELMKITDLRLFHNHMTIEPVLEIFGGYTPRRSGSCGRLYSETLRLLTDTV